MSTAPHMHAASWFAHYPPCVPKTLDYPQIEAWGLLERSARQNPDHPACIYYGETLTYRELAAEARRTADLLVRLGVQPGDRVGVLLPNVPEFLSTLNGIWMAGAAVVAISPLSCSEEISGLLDATACKVIVALDVLAPLALKAEHKPEVLLLTTIRHHLPAWQGALYALARIKKLGWRRPKHGPRVLWLDDELDASNPSFVPRHATSLEDPAFILATGGTTGHPKAVVLSHRGIVANATQIHTWAGGTMARESILAVVPFFHSYGLTSCAMAGMSMAATIVMHHRFVPKVVLDLIEKHRPSVMPAVPAMLVALNHLLRTRKLKFRLLRYCISGGAPLDQKAAAEFAEHTGATVVEGFGLSEAGPVTHAGPLDGTARAGTIGLPLPDTDARIVDAETGTIEMPIGEVGELIVKGPQLMAGYWNNPEATAQTIRDGWLYTGDLAVCDKDGFFTIVDRKKDLIITSGFNVYPGDVEQALRLHPAIADVAIIGVPDSEKGEIVKALIVLKPGGAFHEREFAQFCEQHLAKHKHPRIIELVKGDLPRNFLGKVYRRKLREQHEQANT